MTFFWNFRYFDIFENITIFTNPGGSVGIPWLLCHEAQGLVWWREGTGAIGRQALHSLDQGREQYSKEVGIHSRSTEGAIQTPWNEEQMVDWHGWRVTGSCRPPRLKGFLTGSEGCIWSSWSWLRTCQVTWWFNSYGPPEDPWTLDGAL